jgi:hypothetical protein
MNFFDLLNLFVHARAQVVMVLICVLALCVALKALHVVGLALGRKKDSSTKDSST